MKFKIDWAGIKTAGRTLGALMVGNVFVAAMLLDNRHWLGLAMLLAIGVALIIFTSIERKA